MAASIHIPIVRGGGAYTSVEHADLVDHRSGETIATISTANPGLISRDLLRAQENWSALQTQSYESVIAACAAAADHFLHDELPLGDVAQTPDQFIAQQSATTAMPEVLCRANMDKIHSVLSCMADVLAGLSGDAELSTAAFDASRTDGYTARGHSLGVVLPNNSPGVHALWLPALALRIPVYLRPGTQEPWTPYRILQAFIKAGYPSHAFGLYPSGHEGVVPVLGKAARGMVFGDSATTEPWVRYGSVEVHGTGRSKVFLDDANASRFMEHLDLVEDSVTRNGGRSCVNASSVWTPSHGRDLADALAQRFAEIEPRPMSDPAARLCGFSNPRVAEAINQTIEEGLRVAGAEDYTARYRSGPRLIETGGTTFLLPTVIYCDSCDHPLANREFLFPFVSVVEVPSEQAVQAAGETLVASAIAANKGFVDNLAKRPEISLLHAGPVATCEIDWTRPVEGNLFTHLFERTSS